MQGECWDMVSPAAAHLFLPSHPSVGSIDSAQTSRDGESMQVDVTKGRLQQDMQMIGTSRMQLVFRRLMSRLSWPRWLRRVVNSLWVSRLANKWAEIKVRADYKLLVWFYYHPSNLSQQGRLQCTWSRCCVISGCNHGVRNNSICRNRWCIIWPKQKWRLKNYSGHLQMMVRGKLLCTPKILTSPANSLSCKLQYHVWPPGGNAGTSLNESVLQTRKDAARPPHAIHTGLLAQTCIRNTWMSTSVPTFPQCATWRGSRNGTSFRNAASVTRNYWSHQSSIHIGAKNAQVYRENHYTWHINPELFQEGQNRGYVLSSARCDWVING